MIDHVEQLENPGLGCLVYVGGWLSVPWKYRYNGIMDGFVKDKQEFSVRKTELFYAQGKILPYVMT